MTAAQVPEPTAEQLKTGHAIAFDIITGATNGRSAEAIAAAISAAVAAERSKYVEVGREKANDSRHADRHRTVGNTTFCAVRGCGWSDK